MSELVEVLINGLFFSCGNLLLKNEADLKFLNSKHINFFLAHLSYRNTMKRKEKKPIGTQ